MAITDIGWTHRRIPFAFRLDKPLSFGGKFTLAAGAYEAGTMVPGFTFNGWLGCQRVSPTCANCYAASWANQHGYRTDGAHGLKIWGPPDTTPRVRTSAERWKLPFKWNGIAEKLGVRLRVFAYSLADVGEDHPMVGPWRRDLFDVIRRTPWLEWLLLTKRPDVLLREWPWTWEAPPKNVVVGVTAETQHYADLRIPVLLKIPALWHFASVEAMLGPVMPRPEWVRPRTFDYCPDDREPTAEEATSQRMRIASGAIGCQSCTGDPRDYAGPHSWDPCSAVWTPSVDWWIIGGESGSRFVPGESDVAWTDETGVADWTDVGEGDDDAEKRPRRMLDLDAAERLARALKDAGKSVYFKQDSAFRPGQRGRASDWLWSLKEWPTDGLMQEAA